MKKQTEVYSTYDAILIVSFGGPEGRDDVLPFLENVLRGRNVPRERMLKVAEHYELFDGVSPINGANRKLIQSLEGELQEHGPHLPIYWGNRNWRPLLADTIAKMAADGIKNALAFVTSAYSSYSSCRQYLNDIEQARQVVGDAAPAIDKIRPFYNHPDFIGANVEYLRDALDEFEPARRSSVKVAFTAHSIPQSMASGCRYESQLQMAAKLVAAAAGVLDWQLVYQSRSGPPTQPWLAPDILDYLRELKQQSVNNVVVVPIGFVSDHMEVVYDLDTEAKQLAEQLDMKMVRARTAGTHPLFIHMIRELILERMDQNMPQRFLGEDGVLPDACLQECCSMSVSEGAPHSQRVSTA